MHQLITGIEEKSDNITSCRCDCTCISAPSVSPARVCNQHSLMMILLGRFARDNCPAFLEEQNCTYLREDALDRLEIVTGTFLDQLQSRPFTKACLLTFIDSEQYPAMSEDLMILTNTTC